jgi:hypothetical protein
MKQSIGHESGSEGSLLVGQKGLGVFMSIEGGVALFDLLGKAWGVLRDWRDPTRAQAKRLIESFEAYGIARQQIPRVLPPSLKLPNAAFSAPEKLKEKITPELLDWTSHFLAINRAWLDGVSSQPHLRINAYKQLEHYREFLLECQRARPNVHRTLLVWKTVGVDIGPKAHGPLCLVYQESSEGLDATDRSCYWLLSEGWYWDHPPCISNMVAMVAIAQSLSVTVLGQDIPETLLKHLEAGKKLAAEVARKSQTLWYPEDLVTPLPGSDTAWRQAIWQEAQGWLSTCEFPLPLENHLIKHFSDSKGDVKQPASGIANEANS